MHFLDWMTISLESSIAIIRCFHWTLLKRKPFLQSFTIMFRDCHQIGRMRLSYRTTSYLLLFYVLLWIEVHVFSKKYQWRIVLIKTYWINFMNLVLKNCVVNEFDYQCFWNETFQLFYIFLCKKCIIEYVAIVCINIQTWLPAQLYFLTL